MKAKNPQNKTVNIALKNPEQERELDDVTAEYIRQVDEECKKAQRDAAATAAVPFVNQQQAALQLYIRREKLEGKWQLQPDGKTLRREG